MPLCGNTWPHGQHHTSILNVRVTIQTSLRGLGRYWNSSSLDGNAERRMGLSLAVEGARWGGLMQKLWDVVTSFGFGSSLSSSGDICIFLQP